MSRSTALVIFVKTLGKSPVKTRLATDIGREKAEEFYSLCLRATEARARAAQAKLPGLKIYWAVAEKECLGSFVWASFPSLYQGEGTLGERLATVYREALERNSSACFIGSDSPQISVDRLVDCIQRTESNQRDGFQLGRTIDGGFYFFGGGSRIPSEVWTEVEYSTEKTADELSRRLWAYGSVWNLPEDFDVDTYEDLVCLSECKVQDDLLPEQRELIIWASTTCREKGEALA